MIRRSAVIKAEAMTQTARVGIKPFRLDDVMREARETIAAAKLRAAELIKDAESRAATIRESGHRTGFDEGLTKGRAEAFEAAGKQFSEQQQNLIASYQQTIATIEADRAAWNSAARQDLIELAMAIARRVAHHVGQRERETVLANLEESVRLTGQRSEVTILVNPADAEAARSFAQSLIELQEQWQHVRVVEEPEVSPGGCRVQWGSGAVDATLDTQLDRIEAALKGESS